MMIFSEFLESWLDQAQRTYLIGGQDETTISLRQSKKVENYYYKLEAIFT